MRRTCLLVLTLLLAFPASASAASSRSWASAQIRTVVHAGLLGRSVAGFRPDATLTEGQLEQALAATWKLQNPPPAPAAPPVISGEPTEGQQLAVDSGSWTGNVLGYSYQWQLSTDAGSTWTNIAGATMSSFWTGYGLYANTLLRVQVTAQSQAGSAVAASSPFGPIAPADPTLGQNQPPPAPVPAPVKIPAAPRFTAGSPGAPVTIKQLDAQLVAYLGLSSAAAQVTKTLELAGLNPQAHTGSEVIARLLELRYNHPANEDNFEIEPYQPATRAEAAYSFAQLLSISNDEAGWVGQMAALFTLPELNIWQRRLLRTAVHFVGYPYIWGGESEWHQGNANGVSSPGGFDCSGFVWRVYKLQPYPGEHALSSMLRGRTTYEMSGEVGRGQRIYKVQNLEPGDVLFFGNGPRSSPNEVDHTGIYLGSGWMIHSSDRGVTILPFAGWLRDSFAWARRPLREAGLGR